MAVREAVADTEPVAELEPDGVLLGVMLGRAPGDRLPEALEVMLALGLLEGVTLAVGVVEAVGLLLVVMLGVAEGSS